MVHGGGPAITRRLRELGIESQRVDGLRVTDAATMKVVEDVLFGEVNARIVREVGALDGRAVGVSAKDAGIMQVHKHWVQTDSGPMDIGYVGDVEHIDTAPLLDLIGKGLIPVVAPIGRGPAARASTSMPIPRLGNRRRPARREVGLFDGCSGHYARSRRRCVPAINRACL